MCTVNAACRMKSGADPEFEKGGGAGGSGALPQDVFDIFRGFFEEFDSKRGGCALPAPPSGSASYSPCLKPIHFQCKKNVL